MPEKPLDKTTIGAWRDLAQQEAFEVGLRYLEANFCPQPQRGDDINAQHHDTLTGLGFRIALKEIRERLTQYEAPAPEDPSIPSLQR